MSVDIWFHGTNLHRGDDRYDETLQAVSMLGEWLLDGEPISSEDARALLARWELEDPDALVFG